MTAQQPSSGALSGAEKGPGLCLLAQGDKAGSPGKQPSPAFSPPTPHHRNTSGCAASQNLSSRETDGTPLTWYLTSQALLEDISNAQGTAVM